MFSGIFLGRKWALIMLLGDEIMCEEKIIKLCSLMDWNLLFHNHACNCYIFIEQQSIFIELLCVYKYDKL